MQDAQTQLVKKLARSSSQVIPLMNDPEIRF